MASVWNFSLALSSTFVILIAVHPHLAHPNTRKIDPNFKSLQSGENSGEIVNQCCKRESKFVSIGYGLGDNEVRVDVGHCRKICPENARMKPLKREEFDKFLKKYPQMDPIEIFLSLQHQHGGTEGLALDEEDSSVSPLLSTSSCMASICEPDSLIKETHFSLTGAEKEVDVIESCDCINLPQTCSRMSLPVRVHVGTPYEKTLDVGRCLGPCGDPGQGTQCKAVRNKTVTLEGPNGSQCMEVIDECQCVGDCFRVKEFFKVYDYANVFEARRGENKSSVINKTLDEDDVNSDEDILEPEPNTKVWEEEFRNLNESISNN